MLKEWFGRESRRQSRFSSYYSEPGTLLEIDWMGGKPGKRVGGFSHRETSGTGRQLMRILRLLGDAILTNFVEQSFVTNL
jgi:hypothetical protein